MHTALCVDEATALDMADALRRSGFEVLNIIRPHESCDWVVFYRETQDQLDKEVV